MPKLEVKNPWTGKRLRLLPADDARTVRAKFTAAQLAHVTWADEPLARRLDVVRRFRHLVVERIEALAMTLTEETGKPITQSRGELRGLIPRLDFFMRETGGVIRTQTVFCDRKSKTTERISWEPLGVVANISAWNYPYYVGCNVIIPALLTGNAVLYKPSEFAAITGVTIVEMLHEAGAPRDVIAAIVGPGEVGEALLRQPIDGIFFTGSYATGRRISRAVAGRMLKVQLELGGKDPVYVCDDVDVEKAAASTAEGVFYNNGQSCCAIERLYVHERIFAPFVDAFVAAVKGFKIGDPRRDDTYLGPLTRPPHLAFLKAQVADARKKGARVLLGGAPVRRRLNTFAPTVLINVNHRMGVMKEETFGPMIGIMRVRDDAEAIALMNDTEYGLTAGVYSADEKRAEAILSRVASGSAYWNCCDRVSPHLPWVGIKHSGVGVTLSRAGIETFTRPRGWHLRAPR
jgi:acyl-CoA reductase-like NAD-dependent aldehyde dehydrogenase